MTRHPSHSTRVSDASSHDFVCIQCGATDLSGSGWGSLSEPCAWEGQMSSLNFPVWVMVPHQLTYDMQHGGAYFLPQGVWERALEKAPKPPRDIQVAMEVVAEARRASSIHPDPTTPHEGHAIIREEFDELWDEVKALKTMRDRPAAMRKEAIQLASTVVRFIVALYKEADEAKPVIKVDTESCIYPNCSCSKMTRCPRLVAKDKFHNPQPGDRQAFDPRSNGPDSEGCHYPNCKCNPRCRAALREALG